MPNNKMRYDTNYVRATIYRNLSLQIVYSFGTELHENTDNSKEGQ